MQEGQALSTPLGDPYRSILVPTDLGVDGLPAFAHALRAAWGGRARVTLLHVGAPDVPWVAFPGIRTTLVRWGALPAGAPREALNELGIRAEKVRLPGDRPIGGVLHRARAARSDLIVLASHQRRGLTRYFYGSVSEEVARRARVDCLVLPAGVRGFVRLEDGSVNLRRVVVLAPPRPSPASALRAVARLADALGRPAFEVSLVYVDGPEIGDAVGPVDAPYRITSTRADGGLLGGLRAARAAGPVDLVALATPPRGGPFVVDPLFALLRGVDIPVLVAPGLA